ncbi:MAG TPA: hypothetical protein VE377_00995 [Candidatus Dormibacteraeota bacterium]|nr:hypothetical protein [Candidatus Dormibacteraeota bacterium]
MIVIEQLFVTLVYVGAFGRITWRNRHRTFIFVAGLFTTVMLAISELTVLVVFLKEGV